MIGPYTQIKDIQPSNRVKSVTPLMNGDLQVEQHSGSKFTISKDDEDFKVFVVYSVLAEL